jgi:hypothetical protein
LEGDAEKAKSIFKIKEDVNRFTFFKRAIDLGITYTNKDLSFVDFMLFSWISEAVNGK